MSAVQEAVTDAPAIDAVPKRAMTLGAGTSIVVLLALLIFPMFVKNFVIFQLTTVLIYGIAVLALNILTGGSGQFSLGQSAFYALGAYISAILMEHAGMNYALTLPISGIICFGFGFLFGLPALRLRPVEQPVGIERVVDATLRPARHHEADGGGALADHLAVRGHLLGGGAVFAGDMLGAILAFRRHVGIELERLEMDVGLDQVPGPRQGFFQAFQPDHAPGAGNV